MRVRFAALLCVAAVILSACHSPTTAPGTFAEGRARVLALLGEARAALVGVRDATAVATGPVVCRRTFLGYAVGTTGAQRVEAPQIVHLLGDPVVWSLTRQGPRLARASLVGVEAVWRARGYDIDRRGLSDPRFPKIVAHVGGYEVVATGWGDAPQATLYAVSPCLRR